MILETIETTGIAQLSYLLGDEDAGACVVIDPRRDVDVYLRLARRHGVRIDRVLETHVHADFVCGSRELSARTGAPILVGATGRYGFDHTPLEDGDEIRVGSLVLRALHTPGHSPEHLCYAVRDADGPGEPWAVFTGDALFAGSVGRPDLAAGHDPEDLAAQLYRSIHEVMLPLGDGVLVYPGHGAGSPCGADIGERKVTSIGYERRHSDKLGISDEDEFVEAVLDGLPEEPTYYSRMKKVNAEGSEARGGPAWLRPMGPAAFGEAASGDGAVVVDTRGIEAFGAAHLEGSVNIALRESFAVWAGWILPPDQRVLLVTERAGDVQTAQRHLFRIGLDDVGGYLRGGMRGWIEAGHEYARREDLSIHELRDLERTGARALQLLDVRSDSEWREGHIPGARHVYAPYLLDVDEAVEDLDRQRPVVVYCGTGYRASLAASLLARQGFEQVHNVPGSITAWRAAGYPLASPGAQGDEQMSNDRMQIDESVTVGPQPSREELEALAAEGFRAVMNLRAEGEENQPMDPAEEEEVVVDLGLAYRHFPVSADDLDPETVNEFREHLDEIAKPVFVHCRRAKRSGALVVMDRAVEQGMSGDEALQWAEEMGFECDVEELERFVRDYVDEHAEVTGGGA